MYQKRKIRAEKKNNNQEEKLTKVGINWFYRLKENFLERFINNGFNKIAFYIFPKNQ